MLWILTTYISSPSYYHCDWMCNACASCARYWFSISHRLHYSNNIGNERKVLSFSEGSLIEVRQCTDWFFLKSTLFIFCLSSESMSANFLANWRDFQIELHILKKKNLKKIHKRDVEVSFFVTWPPFWSWSDITLRNWPNYNMSRVEILDIFPFLLIYSLC